MSILAQMPTATTAVRHLHLHMSPVGDVIEGYDVRYYKCAEDTQLYLGMTPNISDSMAVLDWCLSNKLLLNDCLLLEFVINRIDDDVLVPLWRQTIVDSV